MTGQERFVPAANWGRQSPPFPEKYLEGRAPALQDGKWGYADYEREIVIPLKFKFAGKFDQGMARVDLNHQSFFINQTGTRVTPELWIRL